MKEIYIDKGKYIGPKRPVFITLDIGKNFIDKEQPEDENALLVKAKKLIDSAVDCGVDAVKFQTHLVEDEQRNIPVTSPHFNKERYLWLKRNTFSKLFWQELKNYADKKDIIFYSTPMSAGAVQLLDEIGVKLFKVGSADITDLVMIEEIAKRNKPIIISSGMTTPEELKRSVDLILSHNIPVIVMHCISEYPCPPKDLNLRVIETLQKNYKGIPIGLSDHVLEYETAYAAVALGAVAIEKHFTFNRAAFGPDHKVSLTPEEVKKMVSGIRMIESALGSKKRVLTDKEMEFRPVFHKSIVAKRDISAGEKIIREMLTVKRPGGGIYPGDMYKVIGKKSKVNVKKDDLIRFLDLE